jgi:hypothetical protein
VESISIKDSIYEIVTLSLNPLDIISSKQRIKSKAFFPTVLSSTSKFNYKIIN